MRKMGSAIAVPSIADRKVVKAVEVGSKDLIELKLRLREEYKVLSRLHFPQIFFRDKNQFYT